MRSEVMKCVIGMMVIGAIGCAVKGKMDRRVEETAIVDSGERCACKDESLETRAACETLIGASVITSERVGFAGVESAEAKAFARLCEVGDELGTRVERWRCVFENAAHVEGRVYALAGLWMVDRSAYGELKGEVDLDAEVNTLIGCIGDRVKAGKLVEQIERGEFWRNFSGGIEAVSKPKRRRGPTCVLVSP